MTSPILSTPSASGLFELSLEQEKALSTSMLVAHDLTIAPPHEVLSLSPEAEKRFQRTVPTDTVLKVAIRLWVIGTGGCAICETPIDILPRHPHPASAQVDHVQPKSRGGGDYWGNLRVTIANATWSAMTPSVNPPQLALDCSWTPPPTGTNTQPTSCPNRSNRN